MFFLFDLLLLQFLSQLFSFFLILLFYLNASSGFIFVEVLLNTICKLFSLGFWFLHWFFYHLLLFLKLFSYLLCFLFKLFFQLSQLLLPPLLLLFDSTFQNLLIFNFLAFPYLFIFLLLDPVFLSLLLPPIHLLLNLLPLFGIQLGQNSLLLPCNFILPLLLNFLFDPLQMSIRMKTKSETSYFLLLLFQLFFVLFSLLLNLSLSFLEILLHLHRLFKHFRLFNFNNSLAFCLYSFLIDFVELNLLLLYFFLLLFNFFLLAFNTLFHFILLLFCFPFFLFLKFGYFSLFFFHLLQTHNYVLPFAYHNFWFLTLLLPIFFYFGRQLSCPFSCLFWFLLQLVVFYITVGFYLTELLAGCLFESLPV